MSGRLACVDVTLEVPGRVLCRNLHVDFAPGEVWAVLGRNGTGKSTLVHALAGLAAPARGRVELEGRALADIEPKARARMLGVLLQLEEGGYWGSVAEYVMLGRFPHTARWSGYTTEDAGHVRSALEAMRIGELSERRFSSLSGGERQRVRIAQILAQSPGIFLMDEPLQHLDLAHQAHVLSHMSARVKGRGETAVMVLHEPLWIGRACTHAVIFGGDGTADAGPAADLVTRDRLEHAYGCALREVAHGEGRCFVPDV
jgi:iron complex transport system ATP-binding protein